MEGISMTEKEIFDKLVTIVADSLEDESLKEKITMDTNVFTDIEMNSLAILYISMSIENVFGVRITNNDLPNLVLTKDFVRFIKEKVA